MIGQYWWLERERQREEERETDRQTDRQTMTSLLTSLINYWIKLPFVNCSVESKETAVMNTPQYHSLREDDSLPVISTEGWEDGIYPIEQI